MPRKRKLTSKEQASLEWFKEIVAKTTSKKTSKEYDKKRKRISEGEMFLYDYKNPVTPLKYLKWFDAKPLVILFNTSGRKGNWFGVNLHYIPKPLRETFLKLVIKINKAKLKSGNRFDLSWGDIYEFLHRNGLAEIAVKQYRINRIQNLEYIPYSQWQYAVNVPSEQFVFDGQYSHEDLISMTRRGLKKAKTAKNVRYGRKTK